MDTITYSKLADNFYHYAKGTFFEIYPLSQVEFEVNGICRRAADDYLVQIIERTKEMVRKVLLDYGIGNVQKSYREIFIEGIRTQILPQELGDRLLKLSGLRNDVVHENEKVKNQQLLYGELGIIVIVAYSMYEIAKSFNQSSFPKTNTNIIVNRDYLRERLRIMQDNNRHSEYVTKNCEKAKLRLDSDYKIPDILINKSIIWDILERK